MPDSPPQAIHGLLSAYPGRDAASAIRCQGFFIGNRSADACVETSRVLSAGGRVKRAMDGARPSQDMDVLPREKRLPADRTRRPTGARAVHLVVYPLR